MPSLSVFEVHNGESPAYTFMHMLVDYGAEYRQKSWKEEGPTLRAALYAAIQGGLEFDKDDFNQLKEHMAFSEWAGRTPNGGANTIGEEFYRMACQADNKTACIAFENFKGRPVYIHNGKRLFVTAKVSLRSKMFDEYRDFRITSFSADGKSFNAIAGEEKKVERLRVTYEEIRELNKDRKDSQEAEQDAAEKLEEVESAISYAYQPESAELLVAEVAEPFDGAISTVPVQQIGTIVAEVMESKEFQETVAQGVKDYESGNVLELEND